MLYELRCSVQSKDAPSVVAGRTSHSHAPPPLATLLLAPDHSDAMRFLSPGQQPSLSTTISSQENSARSWLPASFFYDIKHIQTLIFLVPHPVHPAVSSGGLGFLPLHHQPGPAGKYEAQLGSDSFTTAIGQQNRPSRLTRAEDLVPRIDFSIGDQNNAVQVRPRAWY